MGTCRKFIVTKEFHDTTWCWDKYRQIQSAFSQLSGFGRGSSIELIDSIGQITAPTLDGVIEHFKKEGADPVHLDLRVWRRSGSEARLEVDSTDSGVRMVVTIESRCEVDARGLSAAIEDHLARHSCSDEPASNAITTGSVRTAAQKISQNPWFVGFAAAFSAGLGLYLLHL
jgi:hypothetical protein